MKNRRWISALLAGALSFELAAVPVSALPPSRVMAYEGQFVDVAPEDWYAPAVEDLYELGLAQGRGEGRFAPMDPVTVAEVVTWASRLRSLVAFGDSETGPGAYLGDQWYDGYAFYLAGEMVEDPALDQVAHRPATRAEAAHILALALPGDILPDINGDTVTMGYASRRFITDVDAYTPYAQDILSLYRKGILGGVDATGTFLPEEAVTRGEMAATLVRMALEDQRLRLAWCIPGIHSKAGTVVRDLVESDGSFVVSPSPGDLEAMDANVRCMLRRGDSAMTLSYPKDTLTKEDMDTLVQSLLAVARRYPEQGYNQVKCVYSHRSGLVTVTFTSTLWPENMQQVYPQAALDLAIEVHDRLWDTGVLLPSMTERERALVYYDWLCRNCTYDFQSTDTSMSHFSYGALGEGKAVCDGYTAAYNTFLRLEGIQCSTRSTGDHIWTVAQLDGKTCHIDLTWGDSGAEPDLRYFDLSQGDLDQRLA